MKAKKLLSSILVLAMILSAMGTIAFADNTDVIVLDAGTYTWESRFAGKTVKAADGAEVIFDMSTVSMPGLGGADVTFEGITFNWNNVGYNGLQHSGDLTYNNCVINGQVYLFGTSETFNGCTFNQNVDGLYNVWTYSAKEVTFNNCVFNSLGRCVLVYADGGDGGSVDVKNTTFNASIAVDGKAAIEIDTSNMTGNATVTVDDATTAVGFGEGSKSGNTLWNVKTEPKKNGSSVVVAVDNAIAYAKILDTAGTVTDIAASNEDNYYTTIQDAIDAAEDDDSIKVYPGDHAPFTVTKDVTISSADEKIKPRIIITEIADGGVKYKAENVAIYNLAFVIDENATRTGGYYPAALGFHVEDNARRSYLKLEDCDFINNSDLYAIAVMAHIPSYDIEACKFVNFATGISTALDNGKAVDVSVTENTFEEVEEFISAYWGVANNGSVTILENKATDRSTTIINIQDYVKNTVGADATAFGDIDIKDNDAKVVFTNYDEDDYASELTGNKYVVYNYTSKTLLDALDAPEGTVYVNYGRDNEESYLVNEDGIFAAADSITIEFVACPNEEDELVYNINLVASDATIINRLNSVDLTFAFTQGAWGKNDFEIIASNSEVAINPVDNSKTRYEFHYDGKTDVGTDTAKEITIGQVKFTGYGAFSFAVDTTATTNVAHATKLADNIVDTFVPGGVLPDGTEVGTFIVAGITPSVSEIAVPTRELTINIAFPNAVENKGIAYQDMKVVISGGDLAEEIEIDLGSDAVETALEIFGKEDAKYVATFANDAYKVIVTDVLTVNNAYTVTVSGAGYRTARYTVTMTDSKELNFWNNVMDEAKAVEPGKASSEVTKNFLAGDIVKDNQINIYDLSAVVSYFASTSNVENGYAKYDLNRDGVIDSKDVAYVLVSWGE